jgi:class 3 adenylate cyclase
MDDGIQIFTNDRSVMRHVFQRFAPDMLAEGDRTGNDVILQQLRQIRFSASPGIYRMLQRVAEEIDVRPVLPSIQAPTLVMHRRDDQIVTVGNGRYLAENIAGAKYLELSGADHYPFWDGDAVLDEIEEFVTGARSGADVDRVLCTIMFTDIVGSTQIAARLGDREWRALLEQHHRLVRRELARFRGHEVDTAGDGFLATFDGPARAIRCAAAIQAAVRDLGLEIRAGVHTGECEVADRKVAGIAVHIAARIASNAGAGEIFTSGTVKDLVAGSGINFDDRGAHALKGVPGEWRLFAAAA